MKEGKGRKERKRGRQRRKKSGKKHENKKKKSTRGITEEVEMKERRTK